MGRIVVLPVRREGLGQISHRVLGESDHEQRDDDGKRAPHQPQTKLTSGVFGFIAAHLAHNVALEQQMLAVLAGNGASAGHGAFSCRMRY